MIELWLQEMTSKKWKMASDFKANPSGLKNALTEFDSFKGYNKRLVWDDLVIYYKYLP